MNRPCVRSSSELLSSVCQFSSALGDKKTDGGMSLVVQWIRICLPMQGAHVQSLFRELGSHVLQGNQVLAPQLEKAQSPRATMKTQHSQKKKKIDLTCLPWRKGKRHRADCSHNGCCTLLCKYIEDSASLEERRSAVFRGARKCFKYRI